MDVDVAVDVAVGGLPAGCAAPPFGCGESVDVDAEADAEGGCAPLAAAAASNSAFSSSVSMLVVALVISFINEISPICDAEEAGRQSKHSDLRGMGWERSSGART